MIECEGWGQKRLHDSGSHPWLFFERLVYPGVGRLALGTGYKEWLAIEKLEIIIKPSIGLFFYYHHGLAILNNASYKIALPRLQPEVLPASSLPALIYPLY